MKLLEKHTIPKNTPSKRFRIYAQEYFKDIYPSNKGVKKAINKALFTLNGEVARTATWIKEGDIVELWEESNPENNVPKPNLLVIYEDEHCMIINKPPGIPIHSRGKHNISFQLKGVRLPSGNEDQLPYPMPVHRLDAPTAGLLITAKTRSFQIALGQLFEKKQVEKRYTAIVLGKLEGEDELITHVQDKSATTVFKSIQHFQHGKIGWLSLIRLYPKTGRTHQLRIHCAEIGFPILGELKYAEEIPNLKGKGLFLVADKLKFIHPINHESLEVTIDLPKKFQQFFD